MVLWPCELLEGTPGLAMAVSALIFLAGVVMFGISLLRSGVYPRPAGWLFVVGFVFVPLAEVVGETVVAVGSILAGISVLWLSRVLWSGSTPARAPSHRLNRSLRPSRRRPNHPRSPGR